MGLVIAFMLQRWGYASLKRWWRRRAKVIPGRAA
jgi:hypothetical protein